MIYVHVMFHCQDHYNLQNHGSIHCTAMSCVWVFVCTATALMALVGSHWSQHKQVKKKKHTIALEFFLPSKNSSSLAPSRYELQQRLHPIVMIQIKTLKISTLWFYHRYQLCFELTESETIHWLRGSTLPVFWLTSSHRRSSLNDERLTAYRV